MEKKSQNDSTGTGSGNFKNSSSLDLTSTGGSARKKNCKKKYKTIKNFIILKDLII